MTRGELRQHVRDLLGEPGDRQGRGYWDDDELNRYIKLESDRHAQEALSVEAQVATSSVPGVIDYDLPDDFGELKDVRYVENITTGPLPLDYVTRQEILSELGEIDTIGDPWCFYKWEDRLGFYPVPNKPPILQKTFSGQRPERYTPIFLADEDDRTFTNRLYLNVEDDDDNPFYRVYLSHISVFLRRDELVVPGNITMLMREASNAFFQRSMPIPASLIPPIGEWITFDFSEAPIEVLAGDLRSYDYTFSVTPDYIDASHATYGNRIEIAYENEVDEDNTQQPVAFFQLHQVKDDIEIDYYRNVTDELEDDDAQIQIPSRYNRTLIKQVAGRALKKNRFMLQAAVIYDREAADEIAYARSQAAVKTLGSIINSGRFKGRRRRPYMTYAGNGRFIGRAW